MSYSRIFLELSLEVGQMQQAEFYSFLVKEHAYIHLGAMVTQFVLPGSSSNVLSVLETGI